MKTKVLVVEDENKEDWKIEEAAKVIKDGGIVAFPTETVYGLGANALDSESVKKIFLAKGRPQDNPLIIHVADFNIEPYVKSIPKVAKKMMEKFWPGPLTLIMDKSDIIPKTTSAGLDTVGVRMPSNGIARELIKKSGVPIAAPSANISGRPSPTDVNRCIEDLDGKVDFILGGLKSDVGVESTILDCTVFPPCVLRPGGITLEMLRTVEPDIFIDPSILKKPEGDFRPKAPGMKYRHYAPKAPVTIINGNIGDTISKINEMALEYKSKGLKVGVMTTDENKDKYNDMVVLSLGKRQNLNSVAQNLFEVLRELDDNKVDTILSEAFEEKGIGIAVMNRLKKAAGFNIINV